MEEKKLYKIVEEFARTEFGCGTVKQQVGAQLGKVDVIGAREIHGDLGTHTEIIAFEVKEEHAAFLSAIGQARAYSIYAHKCYLAYKKRNSNAFTFEEIDIASQLGVGLIEIRGNGCKVISTSAAYSPRDSYTLAILNKIGLFRCTLCHATYSKNDVMDINPKEINLDKAPPYAGQLKKAIKNKKNAAYYLFQMYLQRDDDERKYVYDRRYICKDCVSIFGSLVHLE